MVLQNKYKARASRRYNAARGGLGDTRGGRGRGRGNGHRFEEGSFPSLPGREGGEKEEAEEEEAGNTTEEEEELAQKQKYAPRKMQSNAWRYADPDESEMPEDGQGRESEDEVDLSGLLERVAKLDSSRTSKTLISSEAEALKGIEEHLDDVDVSLLHLLAKNRLAKETSGQNCDQSAAGNALTDEQVRELQDEGRRLLEEKARQEKHERRARILKQSAKSISVSIGGSTKSEGSGNSISSKETRKDKVVSSLHDYEDVDEEDDGPDLSPNDTESFHAEMLTRTQTKSSSMAPPPSQRHTRSHIRPPIITNDADEDFLDTIL